MFTKFLLIQKLEENGEAMFHLIKSDYLQWTFENRRTEIESDPITFPFVVVNDEIKLQSHPPQPETKIYVRENEIIFADDYIVPEGFTIGILFPENFIPTVLKFKDKPVIPIGLQGQFVANAQGQFQIFYNRLAKRSAIVFNIHQNVSFGFKCVAKKVKDEEFPKNENIYGDDFFDVIIDTEFLKIEAITNEDLKIINKTLESTDLDDIRDSINEILLALKSGNKKEAKSSLDKLGKYILNGTSFVGNMTKIIDSYNEEGAPQKFVAKLFEYLNL
jgi:hypothetical protein